jgi:hypothetical protein
MESIQQQISALTHKVDLVYQTLLRDTDMATASDLHLGLDLDSEIVGGAETSIKHARNRNHPEQLESVTQRLRQGSASYRNTGYANLSSGVNYRHDTAEWIIAQQNTLIDSSGVEIGHQQIEEQDLSPQVQIQRLTAQLTAAYSRIAALEEQLLANRWK